MTILNIILIFRDSVANFLEKFFLGRAKKIKKGILKIINLIDFSSDSDLIS